MGDGALVLKRALTDYEEDVIAEILARLPVKSLVRFRCVCKSRRALISDPRFVKKQFSWRAKTYKLIFDIDPPLFLDLGALKDVKTTDDAQSAVTELDFPVSGTNHHSCYGKVVGSCNGLICIILAIGAIMLWNPHTRDCKVLPTPPEAESFGISHYFYGIGYDAVCNDYKVILGIPYGTCEAETIIIHIFALKTGSWRTVRDIDYVLF